VKLLHTSDWHVGKEIRGRSRIEEHRAVLEEIATIADERDVELVIVAGDLFETAAPSSEAESVVYRALLRLAESGRRVAVLAGNHDNARRLQAVAPLLELGSVHVVTRPTRPDHGGVLRFSDRDGAPVQLALVPFVSQRGIVRAADLMELAAFEAAQAYAERLSRVIDALCAGFDADGIGLVAAHGFVQGGVIGGGERPAHLLDEYSIPVGAFPVTASYVALGHLHRPQRIAGASAVHYCGSPLQLDFGETKDPNGVNVVEARPGVPAIVDAVPLQSGRKLRILRGTPEELVERATELTDDCWLRLDVEGPRSVGLGDELRYRIGDHVVDVIMQAADNPTARAQSSRRGKSPHELFGEFLAERQVDDERLTRLFAALLDEASGGNEAAAAAGADA
jgi:exonuclease SbcD